MNSLNIKASDDHTQWPCQTPVLSKHQPKLPGCITWTSQALSFMVANDLHSENQSVWQEQRYTLPWNMVRWFTVSWLSPISVMNSLYVLQLFVCYSSKQWGNSIWRKWIWSLAQRYLLSSIGALSGWILQWINNRITSTPPPKKIRHCSTSCHKLSPCHTVGATEVLAPATTSHPVRWQLIIRGEVKWCMCPQRGRLQRALVSL